MEIERTYGMLGVCPKVYEFGEAVLNDLKPRFEAIDRTAECNQAKVLHAMQKNRVSAQCFAATTGYGYDDVGRDNARTRICRCFSYRSGAGAPADHLRNARADRRAVGKPAAGRRAAFAGRQAV